LTGDRFKPLKITKLEFGLPATSLQPTQPALPVARLERRGKQSSTWPPQFGGTY